MMHSNVCGKRVNSARSQMVHSNVCGNRDNLARRDNITLSVSGVALTDRIVRATRYIAAWFVILLVSVSCTTTVQPPNAKRGAPADSIALIHERDQMPFAHGAIVYVNAMNCEMTAADARQLNAFAKSNGVSIAVVFVGLAPNDSVVVRQASKDLGLNIPARALRNGELLQYKSIGIARMPMAVVIKGKQLATIVTGESMPKTVGLIKAAFSPAVGQ